MLSKDEVMKENEDEAMRDSVLSKDETVKENEDKATQGLYAIEEKGV